MDILRSPDEDTFFSYDDVAAKDEFERRLFSDRLTRIIMEEKGGKPLVISIVNPWGGGKSTILQYIHDALAATTRDEGIRIKDCRITSFNLWRYAGEDQLLYRMFESLIQAIHDGTPLTTGQRLLKLLPTWMKRFSIVCDWLAPGSGAVLDAVFSTISPEQFEVHLDEVRRTTREYLAKTGTRVIMLLDDVDRLDPDEILLLFRALKLIADLPNTTFIIAMDEEHVSEVIGQRIGGHIESGRRYIEKIVNVRLGVPKIPDDVLEDYAMRRFITIWQRELKERKGRADRAGLDTQAMPAEPNPHEVERMVGIFRDLHLPYLLTPRTVKSIENAFAFALGLLPEEVDAGDVLLLEATRLLHPQLYLALPEVIPNLGKLLPIDIQDGRSDEKIRTKKAEIVQQLSALIKTSTFSPKTQIEAALTTWFPQLGNFYFEEEMQRNEQAKRICSPNYFWRYYSGAVHKRDVPDAAVAAWLRTALDLQQKPQASATLKHHLSQPYTRAFIKKLGDRLAAEPDNVPALTIIAQVVSAWPEAEQADSLKNLWHQAASMMAATIHRLNELQKQIAASTEVVRASTNLYWSFIFTDYVATPEDYFTWPDKEGRAPSPFDEELARQSLTAYEQGFMPQANDLICGMIWTIYRNRHLPDLLKRVQSLAEEKPEVAPQLLVAGCNFGSSQSHKPACWSWKGRDSIAKIEKLVPRTVLQRALMKALPPPPKPLRVPSHDFDHLTLQELGWIYMESTHTPNESDSLPHRMKKGQA
ncbi:KAP family P-loop domain-containing protein [Prosthecobacter debontii]|uniref:KAP family P-loop domain-containing protein n=1 Tax=Prosthecobacter debontii TaxID=48467 RepID=A0A1T4XYW0_9BACT|nr:P-loop NTPase fold protein [Prosthecobacter debontii]SKA94730.1 KAP family P-loop domain-containing protein [Prosthecobacter debontii]